ncbi:MAG: MBL fold metallo-hydrolase [Balneolaceae bacterium]|nr:MAG: MBL fold metallo-hydrolase [Balneolaceae bacterium]
MKPKLHFLGAAGCVTGSKFLLELPGKKILIDCGMFQGVKKLRELNWQQLPVHASDIDMILLTHGHLDHTGFLPRLVNMGFNGQILATAPTLDIAEIILRDSAKIQEEDAERANREGYSKHKPALPLYRTEDVENTVSRFDPQPGGIWIEPVDGLNVRFQCAGHILGATFIEIETGSKRLVFSGDIGRNSDPLLPEPIKPEKADILLLESTYGNRLHADRDIQVQLTDLINETVLKGGTLIIPSFAVERAQLLMYHLWQLHLSNKLPAGLPVILDTPMGAGVSDLFHTYPEWHRLSASEFRQMTHRIREVKSFRETWEIIDDPQPKIIIAGSGMITGGRVLSYLKIYLGRPETTVLLAGFQAEGTRGRSLLEGASELKFFGKYYPVKARIELLGGLSGHADQNGLLDWVSGIEKAPEQLFLVHGEPDASDALRVKLKDRFGWNARIPELYEIFEL